MANGTGPNDATTATAILTTGGHAFVATTYASNGYAGLIGIAETATGATYGVLGRSKSVDGKGVQGRAEASTGSTIGVYGQSDSSGGTGVRGYASVGPYGVDGQSGAIGGTGVHGYAAQDGTASGVTGASTVGRGVYGTATTGTGVLASSSSGTALRVEGKASFARSGVATVLAGNSRVNVDLGPGSLAGEPLSFAALRVYRSGVYIAAVVRNKPSNGMLSIFLNKTVAKPVRVSWVVFD